MKPLLLYKCKSIIRAVMPLCLLLCLLLSACAKTSLSQTDADTDRSASADAGQAPPGVSAQEAQQALQQPVTAGVVAYIDRPYAQGLTSAGKMWMLGSWRDKNDATSAEQLRLVYADLADDTADCLQLQLPPTFWQPTDG